MKSFGQFGLQVDQVMDNVGKCQGQELDNDINYNYNRKKQDRENMSIVILNSNNEKFIHLFKYRAQ